MTPKGERAHTRPTERSDDLPYTGPPVDVPDQGADPLDDHGMAVAPDDTRSGLEDDRRLELKAWRDKQIAEGEKPADVDDALRMTIREEIADLDQVETELERVKVSKTERE